MPADTAGDCANRGGADKARCSAIAQASADARRRCLMRGPSPGLPMFRKRIAFEAKQAGLLKPPSGAFVLAASERTSFFRWLATAAF